jgi:hypothetical protein
MRERLTIRRRQGRPAGPSRKDRSATEALDDAGNIGATTIDNAHPQRGGLQRDRPHRVRIIRSYSGATFGARRSGRDSGRGRWMAVRMTCGLRRREHDVSRG